MALSIFTGPKVLYDDFEGGNGQTTQTLFKSLGTDASGNLNAWTSFSGGAASIAANILTVPGSGIITAGHLDWGDLTVLARFKWVTGSTPSIARVDRRTPDANGDYNAIYAYADGTNLVLVKHLLGTGIWTNVAVIAAALVNNTQYWFQMTFVGQAVTVTIFNDSAGAVGSQVATIAAQTITDPALQAGCLWLASSSATATTWGGAFAGVLKVTGPAPTGWAPAQGTGEPAWCWSKARASYGSTRSLSVYNNNADCQARWENVGTFTFANAPATIAVAAWGDPTSTALSFYPAIDLTTPPAPVNTVTDGAWHGSSWIGTVTAATHRYQLVAYGQGLYYFDNVAVFSNSAAQAGASVLKYGSVTMKLQTLDFQLVDPTYTPIIGNMAVAYEPCWQGTIASVESSDPFDKQGHVFVTIAATNAQVGYASASPFGLSDQPNSTQTFAIANPGFETQPATDWVSADGGTGVSNAGDATANHTGTYGMSATASSGANGGIRYNRVGIPVYGLSSLTIKAWIKASVGTPSAAIRVVFANQGANIGANGIATARPVLQAGVSYTDTSVTLLSTWQLYTATVNVPPGFSQGWAFLELFNYGSAAASTAMFDDLTLAWSQTTYGYRKLKVKKTQQSNATLVTKGQLEHFQDGLWPAMSFTLTSKNQGLSAASFSVQDVVVTFIAKGTPVYALTFGDPIVTMSVWTNSQAQAAVLPITSTKITDGAVTTPKLAAGSVTADKLTATLILASLIKAGAGTQHVEMDQNGLRAYDTSGNLVVNIPNDGSPVTVNANLIGKSLTVTGNSIFQGTRNEYTLGSTVQLDSSIGDPAQAPILAQTWATQTLPVNATYDIDSTHYVRAGLDYDAVGGAGGATKVFYQVTQKNSSAQEYILELLASDRTVNRTIAMGVGPASTGIQLLSACRLGSYVYCLYLDNTGSGGAVNLGSTGAATYGYNFSGVNSDNVIAMGPYTIGEHGTITQASVYMGGWSAGCNPIICIWDGSGNLVTNSSQFSVGTGNALRTAAVSSLDAPSGSTYYIGFWRPANQDCEWGVAASGTFRYKTNQAWAPSLSGYTTCAPAYQCGDAQMYLQYTQVVKTWKVKRFVQSTLALDTTYTSVNFPVSPTNPTMCSDGTNLFIVDKAPGATTTIVWQKYDGNLATVGFVIDTSYNSGSGDLVTACAAGNFDFGAWRMALVNAANKIDTFDSTGARQANEQFSGSGSKASGIAYGDALGTGACFWSCPGMASSQLASAITQHSTWTWTTASSIYWVAYSFYDSVGVVHETRVGPRASITMSRRAQLVITGGSLPGTGGVDDPNNLRFYMAPNATDPGVGNFKLQATQVALTYTATSYVSGGAADPVSNNFPGGTPAILQSQVPGWSFKGDGTRTERFRAGAYRNAAFTSIAGWQVMPCDTKLYDPNTNMDVVTNQGRYTAPKAGLYHVDVNVGDPVVARLLVGIYVNGIEVARGTDVTVASGNLAGVASADIYLNAADYVEAWFLTGTAVAMNPGAVFMRFTIRYVGDNL